MDPTTKDNVANRSIWERAVYTVLLWIAYAVAETILTLLVIFQFLCALITGRANDTLHRFGNNLSHYVYQILQFVTFNTEVIPFPFSDWPDEPAGTTPWSGERDDVRDGVEAADEYESAAADDDLDPVRDDDPSGESGNDTDVDAADDSEPSDDDQRGN